MQHVASVRQRAKSGDMDAMAQRFTGGMPVLELAPRDTPVGQPEKIGLVTDFVFGGLAVLRSFHNGHQKASPC